MNNDNDDRQENSNSSVNWGNIYDYYEVQLRDVYKTSAFPQNESHFELLKKYLKCGVLGSKDFAEIGFGSGSTLRMASTCFETVYGLDISQKNVELTHLEMEKEGITNVKLFTSDIMKRDEQFKEKFDVISYIHGLEHFSETDYKSFFETIKYYLKPGGCFTGALPFMQDFNYRMCPHCSQVFEIDGHLSRHNIESLTRLFQEHQWEIIHLDNFNPRFYLKKRGILKFLYRYLRKAISIEKSMSQLEYVVRKK